MSQKNSRSARKKQEMTEDRVDRNNGINKNYYVIIGILLAVLLLLILYIFNSSDTSESESESEAKSSLVVDSSRNESEKDRKNNRDQNQTENDIETSQDDSELEENGTETLPVGETRTVSEDAPYNADYTINYSEGSSDRLAIKEEVIAITGLDNNLIEWWVGQNGPGRVVATVSNASQTEIFEVYLQYGDGSWHVTSYQRLTEVPDFNG